MNLVSGHQDAVAARVERLLTWKSRAASSPRWHPVVVVPATLLSAMVLGLAGMCELARVHALTELLIR